MQMLHLINRMANTNIINTFVVINFNYFHNAALILIFKFHITMVIHEFIHMISFNNLADL